MFELVSSSESIVKSSSSELEAISAALARLRGMGARAVERPVGCVAAVVVSLDGFFEPLLDCVVAAEVFFEALPELPLGLVC